MKRFCDVIIALLALMVLLPVLLLVAVAVKLTSPGPVLYWSDRVGKDNTMFRMPKFRTMRTDTPALATHLLGAPDQYLTRAGRFLRKSSLDEIPQLFCVLIGKMSLVGPRPALFNQADLIELRTQKGIHQLTPGLTGWAQINGRDELPVPIKVQYDEYYLHNRDLLFDLKILLLTIGKVARGSGVRH
jgi:O-antigen biosynthesis protein WbqP